MSEDLSTGSNGQQETISRLVQLKLRKMTVLAPTFFDVSDQAEPGSKSISFLRRAGAFTVEKLSGSQKGNAQEVVYEPDKLELTEEAHIQWLIKKFDQQKSKLSILNNALDDATEAHRDQVDEDIISELVPNIDASNKLTGAITQDKVVDMITQADVSKMPESNRFWAFSKAAFGVLLKIDGFVDASKSNLDIVRNGQIGTLYGVPVLRSDAVATNEAILYHSAALAIGFGAMPAVEDEKAIEYGTGSRRWVMDQLYGVKTMNQGKLAVHCTGV